MQTMEQLAEKYKVSSKTIARDLTGMRYVQKISKDRHVVIQMDTTYWGCNFGLMVIKDSLRKKILWRRYVTHETIADYLDEVEWLRNNLPPNHPHVPSINTAYRERSPGLALTRARPGSPSSVYAYS